MSLLHHLLRCRQAQDRHRVPHWTTGLGFEAQVALPQALHLVGGLQEAVQGPLGLDAPVLQDD